MNTDLNKKGVFMKMRMATITLTLCIICMVLAKGVDAQTITSTPQQSTTGVFQFVATSIDVVGLEDEVSYIVRNELRKSPNLDVINQRELEISLARNDIEQRFSAAEAVKAASVLNLNYVIIGKVSRQSQQIVANIQVISPINEGAIGELTFRFSNQAQISLQSDQIGRELAQVISKHQVDSSDMAAAMAQDWVSKIDAVYDSGEVALTWSLSDPSTSVLGYNVYRATDAAGPFSYLSSETETTLVDSVGSLTGTFYYQVSLIDDEGQELRSNQIASVNVFAEQKSSLQAPSIVGTKERVNSAEFEFFPAAANVGKNIIAYELLRKAPGQAAKVVGKLTLPKSQGGNSNSSNNKPSIQKMKISDTSGEGFSGTVEYAIRAINPEENGQLTDYVPYTAALAPNLNAAPANVLRQISLSWQASTAGFGYKLYRKTPNQADWTLLKELPSIATLNYTDNQIDGDGKEYLYSISVYDDLGETPLSNPIQVTTKGGLAPPINVQGVSDLARKARISWTRNDDPDVTGYSVFRSEYTPDQEFTLTRIGEIKDPLATSFEDLTGLKDNTQYYYSVASLNRFDSSGEVSKPVLIKTKTPPPALEQVSADIQNNEMLISWLIPSSANLQDLEKIVIERKWQGAGGNEFEVVAEVSPSQNQYTDNNLVAGASAEYRLSLVDKTSLSGKASSTPPIQMNVPLELAVTRQGMLRKIALNWKNAQAPAQIKIFQAKTGEAFSLATELAAHRETSFTIEQGLIDDQEYQVKLETWFGNQKLAESNIVVAKTKDIPAPTNLMAQSNQARKVTLTWDKVSDDSIARYVIFRKPAQDTNSELTAIATTENVNQTQYIDQVSGDQTGIQHGNKYIYAVASQNVFEATGFIGTTVEASSKPLPVSPTNVTSNATQSAIELQWQLGNESDLRKLVIERKWPFSDEWQVISEQNASSTFYNDKDLYPFIKPDYRLKVVDADGLESAYQEYKQANNILVASLKVEEEKLLRKNVIAWNNTPNDVTPTVQRRKANTGNWQSIATLNAGQQEHSDTQNLLDQSAYDYRIALSRTSSSGNFELGTTNIVTATTKDLPKAPQLSVQSGLVKTVNIAWTIDDDPDVGGYNLYKLEADGKKEKLDTLKRQENSYTDDGSFFSKLKDGATYSYQIASFNTYKVEGPLSEVAIATTKALPSAPLSLTTELVGGTPNIAWVFSTQDDVVNYEIHRGSTCSRVNSLVTVSGSTQQYSDTSAKAGRSYCYRIRAIDQTELESELSIGATIEIPEA